MLALSSSVQFPSYDSLRLTSGLVAWPFLVGLAESAEGSRASEVLLVFRASLLLLCWNLTSFLGLVMFAEQTQAKTCQGVSGRVKRWNRVQDRCVRGKTRLGCQRCRVVVAAVLSSAPHARGADV